MSEKENKIEFQVGVAGMPACHNIIGLLNVYSTAQIRFYFWLFFYSSSSIHINILF